ncbi:MAG TPA: glycosyltransferase family 39 protein [Acidimicrobiales bacterium]
MSSPTVIVRQPDREPYMDASSAAPPDRQTWWRRPGRPAWALPALGAILVVAAGLYTWDLSSNGMSNSFYAAAVKSGTESWKAFLFGSIDPGSFITVDKPPASLWVMELSGRIFGFSSWSMLLPEALAGIGSVYLLHRTVRRWAGELAAVLAAVALALTPVATLMFRINDPDAFLTFLLVASAAALWAALESGRTRWLVLCGSLIGLAFITKMLEAFIVLPAFGLVYLICADTPLKRRVVQLLWAGLALVVSSGWWVALVQLWPAGSRPYVGGSTDNSELNLIFGYNGFSRVFGSGGAGPGGGGAGGGAGFGGSPGWLRMFNDIVGGQIAWLIPFAIVGLLTGLWVTRRAPRTDLARAGWILFGGWLLVEMAVFSQAKGIWHPYYTVALAPPIAAAAGAGGLAMWRAGRQTRWLAWVLPVAVIATAAWAAILLGRTPGYDTWLPPLLLVGGIGSAVVLGIAALGYTRHRLVVAGAGVVAAASLLAGPAAYSLTTVGSSTTGALASAGPALVAGGLGGGPGGGAPPFGGFGGPPGGGAFAGGARPQLPGAAGAAGAGAGSAVPGGVRGALGGRETVSAGLISYLRSHQGSAKYLVAVSGSQQSAPIILASGQPVITMGGFNGSDPAPTLAQLQALVSSGQVHYVLLGGGGLGGGGGGFGGSAAGPTGFGGPPGGGNQAGNANRSAIQQWVTAKGTVVPASAYGGSSSGTLYHLG